MSLHITRFDASLSISIITIIDISFIVYLPDQSINK